MPGIEDMLTDIRTTGQGVPMGPPPGGPPMGGPPMGGPPMGPPPMGPPPVDMGTPMGSPPVGVDPMAALMGNENVLGGDVERGGGVSIEEDAIALADAVVGRAQGDIEAAVAILDEAKFVLLEGGPQQPMGGPPMGGPPMGGPPVDPMMANMGGSLTRKGDNNSVGKYAGGGSMDKDYFVDFRLKS